MSFFPLIFYKWSWSHSILQRHSVSMSIWIHHVKTRLCKGNVTEEAYQTIIFISLTTDLEYIFKWYTFLQTSQKGQILRCFIFLEQYFHVSVHYLFAGSLPYLKTVTNRKHECLRSTWRNVLCFDHFHFSNIRVFPIFVQIAVVFVWLDEFYRII